MEEDNCPLIGSVLLETFYEDLTRKRPGKMKLFANQRCPPFRVSVKCRFHCIMFKISCVSFLVFTFLK